MVAAFLAAFTALDVILMLHFPLAPDETYYWEWSRRLDWGYYDQGPMIAWWIRASCFVFGESALGIRGGIVAAAAVTHLLAYLITRDLFGRRAGLLGLVLSTITPMAVVGGFVATYDPLLALWWSAALWSLVRAVGIGQCGAALPARPRRLAWLACGLCLGAGLLSKQTMALFVPCTAILLTGRLGSWLRRPEPYAALAVGLLVFVPNLLWQAMHGWVSFGHLVNLSGSGVAQPALRRLGDFVGSQVGLITPLLFGAYVFALWVAGRRWREPSGAWACVLSFSAPILCFFVALALQTKVQANWAVTGWVTPAAAYAAWLVEPGTSRRGRRFAVLAGALSCFIAAMIAAPRVRVALGIRTSHKIDQTRKCYGGPELGAAVARTRTEMEQELGGPVAVAAVTYDLASRLSFYVPGQPRAYCLFLGTRPNSYQLWHGDDPRIEERGVVVADDRPAADPGRCRYEEVFERVEPVAEPVLVRVPGVYAEPVRVYHLYRCYGYRGITHPGAGAPRSGRSGVGGRILDGSRGASALPVSAAR